MSNIELLPCPFCGRQPMIRIPEENDGFASHVSCRCGVQLYGRTRHFSDDAEAAAAWNTRPPVDAAAGAVPESINSIDQPMRLDVLHDAGAGVYVATSPDVPGLVVEAPTREALRREAALAAAQLRTTNPLARSIANELCRLSKTVHDEAATAMLLAAAAINAKAAAPAVAVDEAICPSCDRMTDIRHCNACGCDFTAALQPQQAGETAGGNGGDA